MKQRLFGKMFWREMLPLAIPIALQNLLSASFRLVDMLMIGQLGSQALGAVDLGGQVSFFLDLITFGAASGSAVFIAQYHGANNRDGIHRVLGCVLVFLVPLGIVFTAVAALFPEQIMSVLTDDPDMIAYGAEYLSAACFSYIGIVGNSVLCTTLRSTEKVRLPLITCSVAAGMNALLNYVLIFGRFGLPMLGVRGAGIATSISALTGPAIVLIVSVVQKNILIAPIRKIFDFKGFFLPFWKRSLPVLLNELLWSLSVVIVNIIFGHMGSDNYAGLSTLRTVENLVFVFFMGICHACNILIGKHVGTGDFDGAKRLSKAFLILTPILGLLLGSILLVLRHPIVDLFRISEISKQVARTLLLLYALEVGVRNIPYLLVVGIFRAGGDTKTGFIGDCIVQYAVVIPVAAVLGLVLQLPFVTTFILMQICDDAAKLLIYLPVYFRDKWIHPVSSIGKQSSAQP